MLFGEAAKALKQRDQWIGWNAEERLKNLGFVVNKGRFLLFPWVNVTYWAKLSGPGARLGGTLGV